MGELSSREADRRYTRARKKWKKNQIKQDRVEEEPPTIIHSPLHENNRSREITGAGGQERSTG